MSGGSEAALELVRSLVESLAAATVPQKVR